VFHWLFASKKSFSWKSQCQSADSPKIQVFSRKMSQKKLTKNVKLFGQVEESAYI